MNGVIDAVRETLPQFTAKPVSRSSTCERASDSEFSATDSVSVTIGHNRLEAFDEWSH